MGGGLCVCELGVLMMKGFLYLTPSSRHQVVQSDLRKAVEQSKYGRANDLQRFISPSRKHRFAVMEASISMVATLLPAIEPVDFVTILPSVKSPIGRTVLKVKRDGMRLA